MIYNFSMDSQYLLNSFLLIFIYGGLREYIRTGKGGYKWLNELTQRETLLYIIGRSTFIYTAFLIIQMQFIDLPLYVESWVKVYLYISIIISEEVGSFIFSKLTVKPKEYALAAMIPGFLITIIFFILQLPLIAI